ncbi:MAG: TIGR04290 family methyltransferase [Verrucomicrobia bacterium]|nr:TIGR04290 family methyltransferase [Verrucomicrobiota bacterium]
MQPSLSIETQIRELDDWFQNFEIDGVQTAPNHPLGNYPAIKWNRFAHALPADLTGWSVLEIGTNAGFYAFEMKKRGASRVLGIDTDEHYLRQARWLQKVLGLEVEFRQLSVYQLEELHEQFDLVLFLGVLYHLRHPLLALDIIRREVTRDWLVVQSMLRGNSEVFAVEANYPFSESEHFSRPGYPSLAFVEHSYAGDCTNWWIPNRSCLEAMLRSAGFTLVRHPEAEVYICRMDPSKEVSW